jgi:hypothetical protein
VKHPPDTFPVELLFIQIVAIAEQIHSVTPATKHLLAECERHLATFCERTRKLRFVNVLQYEKLWPFAEFHLRAWIAHKRQQLNKGAAQEKLAHATSADSLEARDFLAAYDFVELVPRDREDDVFVVSPRPESGVFGINFALRYVTFRDPLELRVQMVIRERIVLEEISKLFPGGIVPVAQYAFSVSYVGCLCLATERLDGSLATVTRHVSGDFERQRQLAVEIIAALTDLHRRGVFHTQLRPTNILFGKDGIRFASLGCALFKTADLAADLVPPPQSWPDDKSVYAAPELAGTVGNPAGPDIYSLGAILYELFTGSLPATPDGFVVNAQNLDVKEAQQFCLSIMADRPSPAAILAHPFLAGLRPEGVAGFAVAREPTAPPARPALALLPEPVARPDEAQLLANAEFDFLDRQFRGRGEYLKRLKNAKAAQPKPETEGGPPPADGADGPDCL